MPRSIEYSAIDNMLKWLLPCNTNGELDYFEITLTGKPTYEETEKVTVIDTTVNKNAQIEDIEYSFQITNINGSYDYDVEVRAVLKDGTKGEAAKINFISPVGCKAVSNYYIGIGLTYLHSRSRRALYRSDNRWKQLLFDNLV